MLSVPILTRRTRLRSLAESDAAAVHRILGDRETTAAVSFGQPSPDATAGWIQRRVANHLEHGVSMWAVELLATGELIGLCGFFPHEHDEVELGYVIRADTWRQGFGTEVVSAALNAAADSAGRRVFATIRSTNEASLALARSVGLTEVDRVDDSRGQLLVFRPTSQ